MKFSVTSGSVEVADDGTVKLRATEVAVEGNGTALALLSSLSAAFCDPRATAQALLGEADRIAAEATPVRITGPAPTGDVALPAPKQSRPRERKTKTNRKVKAKAQKPQAQPAKVS